MCNCKSLTVEVNAKMAHFLEISQNGTILLVPYSCSADGVTTIGQSLTL